jgi:hypothetical protein
MARGFLSDGPGPRSGGGGSYKSDLIDISVTLVHQTEKAILVDHGGDSNVWLPKAAVEIERDPNGKTHTITLPQRLATEKGLL